MAFPTSLLSDDMDYLLAEWPNTVTFSDGTAVSGIITGYNVTETLEVGGDEVDLSHSCLVKVSDCPTAPTIGTLLTTPDGALRIVDYDRSPDSIHYEIRLTDKN